VAIASLACVPGARADDPGNAGANTRNFAYGADVGFGATDNIAELATPKRSEEIAEVGVQFAGLEQSARLQAVVAGDLEHLNFLRGTFSPEILGNFSGLASYAVVPEYLRWTLQDNFGQGMIDPFLSGAPSNRENVNIVSTGPIATFPLGEQTLLTLTGNYARTTYQVSPLDNNAYSGGISLARLISQGSRVSVNVQSTRYDYQNPLNPNYDQREAYLRYDVRGARTRLWVDAGYQEVRGSQVNAKGFLGRFNATRTLAADSFLTLTAGREDSNSAAFLAQNQNVSGIGLEATPGRQTSSPFTNEYVTGSWTLTRRRTTLDFIATRFKQVYPDQTNLNQTLSSGSARVTRVLYPTWSIGLYADYSKVLFEQQPGNYKVLHGGAEMRWRMGRKFSLRLLYDHYKRDGDVALYSYSENRVWLRLQYGDPTALQARMTATQISLEDLGAAGPARSQLQGP
jgi:hypothetical protein